MTRAEIASIIESFGLPFAYDHFEESEAQNPPFICFLYPGRNDFSADNVGYVKITELAIELYTDAPDMDLETEIETALDELELFYGKEQTYIDSEHMYQTTYTMEVIING